MRKSVNSIQIRGKLARLLFLAAFLFITTFNLKAQNTAVIDDAWWTYQQDCNGDTFWAGTLPGNLARLNWNPDVANCNGTLSVFEIVYSKPHSTSAWNAIYTNAAHAIVGCRSSDAGYLDVPMGNFVTNDYKIELYRVGQVVPDDIRSSTNDADLSQHREEFLANDACESDFFATPVNLTGKSGSHTDDNTYATKEPGEPDHAGNPGGKSLWYMWTATTNTPVTFDTLGSTFDTLLAVYTGSVISNLTVIATNDDINGAAVRQSSVTFTPVKNTTYLIAVDGFAGASGLVQLNWNQSGGALPDLIVYGPACSPTVITRTFASNDCEVVEGCEPVGTRTLLSFTTETRNIGAGDLVLGDPSTNALFIFASCHQHYHFEHFANYNLLDVNSNIVAGGHKVGFCLTDVHAWSPTAKTKAKYGCTFQGIQAGWADVYEAGLPCQYIDITGVAPGNYTLQIIVNPDNLLPESDTNNNVTEVAVVIPPATCTGTPVNDNFANAIVITNWPFTYSEFNTCASREPGEPNHLGAASGYSVWFSWTAPSNQTAVVNTKRSDFDTILAVYTGPNVSNLTLVASNDDIVQNTNLQSQLSFSAHAGTTYYMAVDGYSNVSGPSIGTVVFNFNPPANDDFSNAFVLTGTTGSVSDYNVNASKEAYEPAHAGDVGGHSVWYKWVAPQSGPVNFDTMGSTFDTTLAVYTNVKPAKPVVTNLTAVVFNDDDSAGNGLLSSRVGFNATSGTTYMIAIDGFGGDTGYLNLNWTMDSKLGVSNSPGDVQVSLTGITWQRYQLIESSDMIHWTTNAPVTMPALPYVYNLTNETSSNGIPKVEFYKAVLSQ